MWEDKLIDLLIYKFKEDFFYELKEWKGKLLNDIVVVESGDGGKEKCEIWGYKVEFIFVIVGLVVGLGNVWRFLYFC